MLSYGILDCILTYRLDEFEDCLYGFGAVAKDMASSHMALDSALVTSFSAAREYFYGSLASIYYPPHWI